MWHNENMEPTVEPTLPVTPSPAMDTTQQPILDIASPQGRNIIWQVVIAVIFASIVGYLYWQNTSLKQQLTTNSAPVPDSSPTASADPTAGWETYTANGRYEINFKYPQGGELTVGSNPSQIDVIRIAYPSSQLEWMVQENNENLGLEEYIKKHGGQYPGSQMSLNQLPGTVENNKIIGKLTGTYIVFPKAITSQHDTSGTSIHFYTANNQHGSLVHWIRYTSNQETLSDEDYRTFAEIIKSAHLN